MGKALDKLAALLHNGEVGGEVGVVDIVKAQGFEGGDHAAGGGHVQGEAEVLRPGGANGGRYLHHGDDVGVGQGFEHLHRVVPLVEGAHGAVGDALGAVGAVGVLELAVFRDVDRGARAGAGHVPDIEALHLVADLNAAHALDALGRVANEGQVLVPPGDGQLRLIGRAQEVHIVGQLLQGAVAAADAGGTPAVVLGEDKLQIGLARLAHPGGVGVDLHALGHLVVAGGHQAADALDLHHADAAGSDLVDVLEVAQAWNVDPVGSGGLQNGGALLGSYGLAVNGQRYHLSILPPLKLP